MGAVAMITMAQSAANCRNTHMHSRGSHTFTHTLTSTHLQLKRQLSYYIIWNRNFIFKVPEGGGENRSTRRKTPTACRLIGIT